jgi:hypothetical protein
MNCTQVKELLPLYAGHDLANNREHLVTAHLQTCAACSLASAAYRDARELMHGFAPPVFGDEVYAEIRQNVWKQIERVPRTRSRFESIAIWFQPRLAWAAAVVLLISVSVAGWYLITKQFAVRSTVVINGPKPEIQPQQEMRADHPVNPGGKPLKQRQADIPRRQRKLDRMVAPDRSDSVVAYSPDAQVNQIQSSAPVIGTDNLDLGARGEKTLRMEIQTKNPNIRIIWFAPSEPKPVTPSKGI